MRNFKDESKIIAGVDEVGRGALAGPVVAAAVVLPAGFSHPLLRDSKKLKPHQRRVVEKVLYATEGVWIGIGMVDNYEIDRINIRQATLKAMYNAVCDLPGKPDLILVDGLDRIPGITIKQTPLVDGESLSDEIAAASIIAKCLRDRIMVQQNDQCPGYGLDENKGYGTVAHLAGLQDQGPCSIHRQTYKPVKKTMALYQKEEIS